MSTPMSAIAPRQPLMHDLHGTFQAPYQVWSATGGNVSGHAVQGYYLGDTRILTRAELAVDQEPGESLSLDTKTSYTSADSVPAPAQISTFRGLSRNVDGPGADPTLTVTRTREVSTVSITETIELTSANADAIPVTLSLDLAADLAAMEFIKGGEQPKPRAANLASAPNAARITWAHEAVTSELTFVGLQPTIAALADNAYRASWQLTLTPDQSCTVQFRLAATDSDLPVQDPQRPALQSPSVNHPDPRMRRLVQQSIGDLSALRLTAKAAPDHCFYAAGAPWFFTLFGRDSILAARLGLQSPDGLEMARDTLFTLAALQGSKEDFETAEEPGKILHEVRRSTLAVVGEGFELPPLYYGTIDATPLWIMLLQDAVKCGLPPTDLEALRPNLEAALAWMRDFGDSDGDGFLEYIDKSGKGLANQGWKDSGDSVRHPDGSLAKGPIALCEVQGYAYAAATGGAELLELLGADGSEWFRWATRLAENFRAHFWVSNNIGRYPAIALDAEKKPVASLTSNIGHLPGTGMLSPDEIDEVANCLAHHTMNSGFGLRTLSSENGGYWPLRYHAGAVWTHDTAYSVLQLALAGTPAARNTARILSDGILRAAESFDYRLPELYAGYSTDQVAEAVPYPASCRPQAWAAASAIALLEAHNLLTSASATSNRIQVDS